MRLIDADKLIGDLYQSMFYSDSIPFVEQSQTIEAVQVVRCKDCKYWTKQTDSAQGKCELLDHYPTGRWYCANGEEEGERK